MIKFQNIKKRFGSLDVFKDLSFTVYNQEILSILGPSGCGKTTILRIIAGLDKIDGGIIQKEKDIKVSFVFQEPRLLPWKTVYQNIKFVLKNLRDEQNIAAYLKLAGLEGFENYYPKELSGGMKQRVALVRAFIHNHNLLLMDEPFSSLDAKNKSALLEVTSKLWAEKLSTIVFVTHNIDEALLLGNRILVLSEKPAHVVQEFSLKMPHQKRDLNSDELLRTKSQIIKYLKS